MRKRAARRSWAAVCCLAALAAIVFAFSIGPADRASAGEHATATSGSEQLAGTVAGRAAPPDYFKELTERAKCRTRPHVEAPQNGGDVAGKCVTVDSFQVMLRTQEEANQPAGICSITNAQCDEEGDAATAEGVATTVGTQYSFLWSAYRMTVNVAAWFTQWGVSFQLFDKVSEFAETLRTAWDSKVIGQVDLDGVGGFVLVVAVLWAGMLMLFHRFRRGFAELAVAVLLATVAATFILHPGDTIKKTMDSTRFLGLTVALVSLDPGGSQDTPDSLAQANEVADRRVSNAVAGKFVSTVLVKPHMIANTGKVQTGACERRYWEMLAANGEDARSQAFQRFADGNAKDARGQECVTEEALRPTVERVVVATLLLVMALIVGAFCLLAVGLLLLSQVAAAAYLAVAPVVAALAPLPGWGRGLLVKWLTGLLVAVAGVIASLVVVVVYLNVLGLILGLGESPLANFALALVVVVAGFKLRKRLTTGLRRGAQQIGAKLEGTLQRPGGETMVEREQRRHTSRSHLRTATAVAAGAGAVAAGGALGRRVGDKTAGRRSPPEGDGRGGADGSAKAAGFGNRVRHAMTQTRHGRLAVATTSRNASPLPGAAGNGGAALGGPAARTASPAASGGVAAAAPAGGAASGERAARTASRVAGGTGSSNRTRELVAEMQRRQREREQELARRRG